MAQKIDLFGAKMKCLRCGHIWMPRKEVIRLCPNCKSVYFDVPVGFDKQKKSPIFTQPV